MATNLLPTPFHARLVPWNANHNWERWEGWLSVGAFDNVEREYFAIRNAATLYDISPITQYEVTGPQAAAFMDRLVTRDMTKVKPGRAAYALWCDDDGNVVEDGTIFRLAEDRFLVTVQEHNLVWFEDTAWGMDVTIADVSERWAGLSVQGPLTRDVLVQAGLEGVEALRPFDVRALRMGGTELLVSRTGFTGDLGYELFCAPADALALWDRLFDIPLGRRVLPIGSHALNLARIEAGFLQVNVDFVGSQAVLRNSQKRSPFELSLDWLVALDKPAAFVGQRALKAELAAGGPKRRVVGLDVEGNKPAVESFLYDGKREVGLVTSAMWSPTCKRNIAIASVDAGCAALGTRLEADIWFRKELRIEKTMAPCRVVERPFWNPARKRS